MPRWPVVTTTHPAAYASRMEIGWPSNMRVGRQNTCACVEQPPLLHPRRPARDTGRLSTPAIRPWNSRPVGVDLEPSGKVQLDPASHVVTETEPRVHQVKVPFSGVMLLRYSTLSGRASENLSKTVLLGDEHLVLGTVRHHVDAVAIDHAGKNLEMRRTGDDDAAEPPDEPGVDLPPSRVPIEQLPADRSAVQVHEQPAEAAGADEIDRRGP